MTNKKFFDSSRNLYKIKLKKFQEKISKFYSPRLSTSTFVALVMLLVVTSYGFNLSDKFHRFASSEMPFECDYSPT
jgi:hypothetical protein